jgi:hypothetical protein
MQISDIGPFFGGLVSLALAAAAPVIRWLGNRRQVVLITGKEYLFQLPEHFKAIRNDWNEVSVNRLLPVPLRETVTKIVEVYTVMSVVVKNDTVFTLDNCFLSVGSPSMIYCAETSSRGLTNTVENPTGPIGMGSIQPRQEVSVVVWTRSFVGGNTIENISFHCDQNVKTIVNVRWEETDKYYKIIYLNKKSIKLMIFQFQLLLTLVAIVFFGWFAVKLFG